MINSENGKHNPVLHGFSKLTILLAVAHATVLPLLDAETANHPAVREYTVPVCEKPPLIDGAIQDDSWKQVEPLGEFYVFRSGGKTVDAAKARMLRDRMWLYLSLEIKVPDAKSMQQTVSDHDLQACNDDSVELFIEPGADGKNYLHYMLSAFNARSERRIAAKGYAKDFSWNYPWRSATKRTDQGWQAEVAIPLTMIQEEGGVEKLTMNICLNRIILDVNHMGAIIGSKKEHSSWAYVRGGFHEPESFGRIKGLRGSELETPLLVTATGLETSRYQVSGDGQFSYTVTGKVHAVTDTPGTARVLVTDRPASGAGETVSQDLQIAKAGHYPFSISVPIAAFTGRTATVSLVDPDTGELIQSVELRNLSSLTLMSACSRFSYYTSEKDATILCRVGLPEEELSGLRLVAVDAAGKRMARQKRVRAETFFSVPLKALSSGRHEVQVNLCRRKDVLISKTVELVKLPPKPGHEWKIDYHHMSVMDNGELFFPFGVMYGEDAIWEREHAFRDVAEMGFNMVIRWRRVQPGKALELYELAEKYGLKVFEFPGLWRWSEEEMPPMPEELRKSTDWKKRKAWSVANVAPLCIEKVVDEPLLMGWYLCDEPGTNLPIAESIKSFNQRVYAADGYHPTEVLYIPPIPGGEFTKNCDIYGIDPYWIPGSGRGETGNPNRVGRQTWLARRRGDRDRRIVWVTPCAERFSGIWRRYYTEDEQRTQTYLALINGAKGIIYFLYPFRNEVTARAFRRLGAEMKVLGPACAQVAPAQEIAYTPPADFANSVHPDVQLALKEHPDGRHFLIGANWKPYPVDLTCTVSSLGRAKRIQSLFEKGESVPVKDGAFSIQVPPMGTMAYVVPGPGDASSPVRIAVQETALRGKTNRFHTKVSPPKGRRPGSRNLFFNSSFEESDIPGSPNYIRLFYFYKWIKDTRVGEGVEDPPYILDETVAYHRKQSLKIDLGKVRCLRIAVFPEDDRKSTYTLSAWVRSEGTEKHSVSISGHKKRFAVASEWQRISAPITFPEKVPQWGDFMQFNLYKMRSDKPVFLWMDAIQLEKGDEPTEYEP